MRPDYDLQPPTRTCCQTGQPLAPGERYHAALLEESGQLVRKDFSTAAWSSPPSGTVAHWASKVPTTERSRKPGFNDELLFNCFRQLEATTDPQKLRFRYIVALLLMRRRRLKFEDVYQREDGSQALVVRDTQTGTRCEVLDPHLSEAEIDQVQQEVFAILGWD